MSDDDIGRSLPQPEVKHFSRKALRRIERDGPREADIRDEAGRIVKDVLPAPPDAIPPDWRLLPRVAFSELVHAIDAKDATSVEVWADRDPSVYWPPQPIHQPFLGKRCVATLTDGSRVWAEAPIPEMETVVMKRLITSEGALPYTFHQTPGRDGYSKFDLGMIAIAGGIFIFTSIYLGIVRKTGIPTDTIQAIEFGQSKAKSRQEGKTGVTFADVAGLDTVLGELQEVVAFLKEPTRFNTVGARAPRGLLLEGGPGTGKTLVAKAIAGEAGVPFYSMSGSEFVEIIVGVGAARVRDLFKRARVNAPCIIFVDEIDALGGARSPASRRGNEEREQTLNQLLTEMDGFTPDTGVIFVGATNRADLLDPALLRPGRFDRRVTVRKPDAAARAQALRIHLRQRKVPTEADLDLEAVAASLVGFSGAEVANAVNEAAMCAVRRGAKAVAAVDFAVAQDRLLLGVVRDTSGMAASDARRIALHEAGHALVSALLRRRAPDAGLLPLERVSVQARGGEWSRTVWARTDEASAAPPTRAALLARMRVLLAGRAAEATALRDVDAAAKSGSAGVGGLHVGASTLAVPDLQDAATLARRLVGDYGLAGGADGQAGHLTPFTWDTTFAGSLPQRMANGVENDGETRLVQDPVAVGPSAQALKAAEGAVNVLLAEAQKDVAALLEAHAAALIALADALQAADSVSGQQVEALIHAHPPTKTLEPPAAKANANAV